MIRELLIFERNSKVIFKEDKFSNKIVPSPRTLLQLMMEINLRAARAKLLPCFKTSRNKQKNVFQVLNIS